MSCIVFVPTSLPINIFDTRSYLWAYKYPEVCGIGLSILTNTNLSETKLRTTVSYSMSSPVSISPSWKKKLFSNMATTWTSREGLSIEKENGLTNHRPITLMAIMERHMSAWPLSTCTNCWEKTKRGGTNSLQQHTSPHALIKRQTS
jgi:hypothetical protein